MRRILTCFLVIVVTAINCLAAEQKVKTSNSIIFEDDFNKSYLDKTKWQWSREGVSLRDGNLIIGGKGHVLTQMAYPEGELEIRAAVTEKLFDGTLCWGWRLRPQTNPRITFSMENTPNIKYVISDTVGQSTGNSAAPLGTEYHIYKIIWNKQKITFLIDNKEVFNTVIPVSWKMQARPISFYNTDSNNTLRIDWIKYTTNISAVEFAEIQKTVKVSEYLNNPMELAIKWTSERTAFYRMEKTKDATITITNNGDKTFSNLKALISLPGTVEKIENIPNLPPKVTHSINYPIDTSLRNGNYDITLKLYNVQSDKLVSEDTFPLIIVPRENPDKVSVILWDVLRSKGERDILKDLGFTHYIYGRLIDYEKVFKAGKPCEPLESLNMENSKKTLDMVFGEGWHIMGYLFPGRWLRTKKPEYYRVDRDGKPYDVPKKDICGLYPDVQKFSYDVGVSVGEYFKDCPALNVFDLQSECKDYSQVSFFQIEKDAFKKYSGLNIPDEIKDKGGVNYKTIKNFPANRVISENNPIYLYYKWYYKEGEGWNQMDDELQKGLHSSGREDWWTYYGPATRAPSLWGSGGNLEGVANWTYAYPDPTAIAMCTDQLIAMAKSVTPQKKIINGIQIICYRSLIANAKTAQSKIETASVWEDSDPDAAYITVPPVLFRIAFWTELARPLDAFMFHGVGSLIKTDIKTPYRLTNTQTQDEFKKLMHEVVQPFGPMLQKVKETPCDIAFLESFTSQMFAKRGNYGWTQRTEGIVYMMLQYAQLQAEIIYEETLIRDGLSKYKILVMPCCDVLTENIVKKINEFQTRGGIIVADEAICPAIKPDITIKPFDRVYDPKRRNDEDKKNILKLAENLKTQLDGRYTGKLESSDVEVITRLRTYGNTDYIFVVNDHREYGTYVGQYKATMEQGLPTKTSIILRRNSGVVYDLMSNREIKVDSLNGTMKFDIDLGPGEGKIFMVTGEPLSEIRIDLPENVKSQSTAKIITTITSSNGLPVSAIVPLKIKILDPEGRESEYSGYYGARDGKTEINLDIAPNDVCGVWAVNVKDLASGKSQNAYMRVSK